ncbi:MAG: hypothetical protein M1839_008714 [Geoglossum umbratile]|nr:MAG: hypothetical protein M1839_008714 [Geoglossum umbratile]
MAGPNGSSELPTPTPTPTPLASHLVLDSLIPGFSVVSQLLAQYFRIDISFYISSLIILLAVAAGLRFCGTAVLDVFKEYFVSTAEIRLDDEMYNYLLFWVANQPFSYRTRQFVASTKTSSHFLWVWEDDEGDGIADDGEDWALPAGYDDQWMTNVRREKIKPLRYTPSEGTHIFRYKGHFLAFTRVTEEKQQAMYVAYTERIYVSCLGRNTWILKELLDEAQRSYLERDWGKTIIYRGCKKGGDDSASWVRCMSRPPRLLSTVVLDEAQKQAFVDDIKEYLHPWTRRWYSNRGIPYRRGYLFYGPPGTGKTSLCFAVSGFFGLKIYVVSLNSRSITEDSLESLFHDLPRYCIVLLEDIDTAGITEERRTTDEPTSKDPKEIANEKKEGTVRKGVSLSALLNVIDGVASSEGRILVMTTNYIEKLDSALLRPGRVDMTIGFGYADSTTIAGLFRAVFAQLEGDLPYKPTESGMNGIKYPPHSHITGKIQRSDGEVAALATEFAERVPGGEFTPAEVQGYLLKWKRAPEKAIEGAEAWVVECRAEKERRIAPSEEEESRKRAEGSGKKITDSKVEEDWKKVKEGSESNSESG